MEHDVFISYSSKDKPTADAVCATLEAKGIRCWIAPRDVMPSLPYGEALIEAIKKTRLMVLVFSANSNSSKHVMREVERAVSREIPIIPFRVEDVPLSPNMEYFLSAPHWLDALTPPLEQHLARLAQTVKLILSSKSATATGAAGEIESPAEPHAQSPTSSVREGEFFKRALIPAIGLILVLAATLFIGWFFYQRSAPVTNTNVTNANAANTDPRRNRNPYADDYNMAASKLASIDMQERLGGIQILERVAGESEQEYWTVMDTLAKYVQNKAPWKGGTDRPARAIPIDIQASLAVLSKRAPVYLTEQDRKRRLNLSGTDLRGLDLRGEAHLENFILENVHLEASFLRGIHLEKALLTNASLEGADLYAAHFDSDTDLAGTNLSQTDLQQAEGLDPKTIQQAYHWECAKYSGDFLEKAREEASEDVQCK